MLRCCHILLMLRESFLVFLGKLKSLKELLRSQQCFTRRLGSNSRFDVLSWRTFNCHVVPLLVQVLIKDFVQCIFSFFLDENLVICPLPVPNRPVVGARNQKVANMANG